MSNPFDQFAVELNAAIPGAAPPADDSNPFSFAPPAAAPMPSDKPAMNGFGYGAPPQPLMGQAQPMYGGMPQEQPMYGGAGQQPMYGGMPQEQPMYGGAGQQPMYGMPQEQPMFAATGQPPSMNGMGGPPPPQQNGMGGMPPMGMGGPPPPAGDNPFSTFGAPPPPAPEPASNPFDAPPAAHGGPADPFSGYGAPPPGQDSYGMAPQAPPTPNPYGGPLMAPPQQAPPAAPPTPNPYGAPSAWAPPTTPSDPYASAYGAPAPPMGVDPYGVPQQVPPTPNAYGAPPPQQQQPPQQGAPGQYGALPPGPPLGGDSFGGYGGLAPPGPPANYAHGGYGAPPPAQQNPYGAPVPQIGYGDPFGAPQPQDSGALVVSQFQSNPYGMPLQQQQQPPPAPMDPFSVFEQAPAPAPPAGPIFDALVPAHAPPGYHQQHQQAPPPPSNGDDLWSDLGFDSPPSDQGVPPPTDLVVPEQEKKDSGDLPPGGEFYDARIFTPTLGVMFFKPHELTDSLFLNTERNLVDSLNERPVVAFIVEGSSARSAGVELGHVLLKVNGVDVKNPKEASRLIKEGPRPLPLLFYVPNTEVVVAEGEHMVKYDVRETTAPNSAKDWKPKYVVIGGIIAQPWMMNMYRSKSEYDIAVIETQARRPVSVKVKQFSLQGARVQNDWQGPQMVKYKNKLHPWKYIVVLPVARNPIKISSPNLAQLKPVHEGIRRVLLAQQRGRGGGYAHSAAPVQQESRQNDYDGEQDAPPPPQRQIQQAPPQQQHQMQPYHQPQQQPAYGY